MFYCEPCRIEMKWPESISHSYGQCEVCDRQAVCNSMRSGLLPVRPIEHKERLAAAAKPAVSKGPQKINYDRLNDFISLFTKAERDSWADGGKAPDWVLEAMLWFMAQDPGHQELMRRLADS